MINNRLSIIYLAVALIISCIACQSDHSNLTGSPASSLSEDLAKVNGTKYDYLSVNAMLVLPENPIQGESFSILVTGKEDIRNSEIIISGPSANSGPVNRKAGNELPCWRIDEFAGSPAGRYKASVVVNKKVICSLEFDIAPHEMPPPSKALLKTSRGWDNKMETIYSAWVNALFSGCTEQSSWSALHEVTQNKNQNFLYNYLSLGEDDKAGKNSLIMLPDCADNPFFLRAYFAWKLGLPFGYHVCDRGNLERKPKPGQWITNGTSDSKNNTVAAFNTFLRRMKDGVQSGTARTALDDENSDYYPVPLEKGALRPGTVFADPYGHTLILIALLPQLGDQPGLLLSVDAQPDGTVAIKRFWKGNFLFNTSGVVGEPGFKAFRPISLKKNVPHLMKNEELTAAAGFVPFSLQQRKMASDLFYRSMERLINPKPLDPETALLDLIQALYEQLLVRVTSVANGEVYFKSHQGALIPMPSSAAGIFQTGGLWEDFSTPNRDLRLLIAMDAVLDFPDRVGRFPEDFKISGSLSPDQAKKNLREILAQKASELSINYIRTNGSLQKLTVGEILKRRDAFEMAYNPNDGIERRWGAPENSDEIRSCRRRAPSNQIEKMKSVRTWFSKRLHPPT